MVQFILIPKGLETAYRKKKLNDFFGIDAVEIANGDFILPERVIADIESLGPPFVGLVRSLENFPVEDGENIEFIEYDDDGNRIN